MLSLGDLGWIQITNFVATGTLFGLCALGVRHVLHPGPGGTWPPLALGLFGLSQIAGGLLVADPALGFPIGAAEGMPDTVSWHGRLHGMAFIVGVTSWSCRPQSGAGTSQSPVIALSLPTRSVPVLRSSLSAPSERR